MSADRRGNEVGVQSQPWRRSRALRRFVGSALGLLVATTLFRVFTGQWGDHRVTIGMLLALGTVTVLQLLMSYWENKDSREDPTSRRR